MGRWIMIGWILMAGCAASGPTGQVADLSEESGPRDPGLDLVPEAGVQDLASQEPCAVLFGRPNEKTGLDASRCRPSCDCAGMRFSPPAYDEAHIAALEDRVLESTLPDLLEDPYRDPERHRPEPAKVCGVLSGLVSPRGYRLQTYETAEEAQAAGATMTHQGACGLCSTLKDLAVYMRHPDLTAPVRECGLRGMIEGDEALMECLLDLGFTLPCARIWAYNTLHTAERCQSICLALLAAPYHDPETGELNACLRCDEEESGAVFQAVAGRTRRNTGLPSSMCRPCEEVVPVVHIYP